MVFNFLSDLAILLKHSLCYMLKHTVSCLLGYECVPEQCVMRCSGWKAYNVFDLMCVFMKNKKPNCKSDLEGGVVFTGHLKGCCTLGAFTDSFWHRV